MNNMRNMNNKITARQQYFKTKVLLSNKMNNRSIEQMKYLHELRLNLLNDLIGIRRRMEEEKNQERELEIMRRINAPRRNRLNLPPISLNNPRNGRNITENNRSANNSSRFNSLIKEKIITEIGIDRYKSEICVICQENYAINDKICYLPCIHSFHSLCINKYLKIARKCPICKCDVRL